MPWLTIPLDLNQFAIKPKLSLMRPKKKSPIMAYLLVYKAVDIVFGMSCVECADRPLASRCLEAGSLLSMSTPALGILLTPVVVHVAVVWVTCRRSRYRLVWFDVMWFGPCFCVLLLDYEFVWIVVWLARLVLTVFAQATFFSRSVMVHCHGHQYTRSDAFCLYPRTPCSSCWRCRLLL